MLALTFYYFWNQMYGKVVFKQSPLHWANFLQKLEPELTFWHVFSCAYSQDPLQIFAKSKDASSDIQKERNVLLTSVSPEVYSQISVAQKQKGFGRHPACKILTRFFSGSFAHNEKFQRISSRRERKVKNTLQNNHNNTFFLVLNRQRSWANFQRGIKHNSHFSWSFHLHKFTLNSILNSPYIPVLLAMFPFYPGVWNSLWICMHCRPYLKQSKDRIIEVKQQRAETSASALITSTLHIHFPYRDLENLLLHTLDCSHYPCLHGPHITAHLPGQAQTTDGFSRDVCATHTQGGKRRTLARKPEPFCAAVRPAPSAL